MADDDRGIKDTPKQSSGRHQPGAAAYCTNAGMTPLASEWWHFNDLDAQNKVRMTSGNGKFWLDGCVSWKMFEE